MTLGLDVDFGHKGAGRVHIDHLALGGGGGNGLGHTMGGKDHGAIIGAFIEFFDKHRAFVTQTINDEFIVNDFVAHIDRRAPFFDGTFDDLNRAYNARAKPARRSQIKSKGGFGHGAPLYLCVPKT